MEARFCNCYSFILLLSSLTLLIGHNLQLSSHLYRLYFECVRGGDGIGGIIEKNGQYYGTAIGGDSTKEGLK